MASGAGGGQPSAPHAILIVDDAPTNLIAYRAALDSLRRDIVTATSGREAMALLEGQQFSLLLIDVRMPGMDGFATVERLRDQLHKLTPVIFITGDGDGAAMRRAYEFGAVDYLVKPVPPEVLLGKVRNLLVLYDQGIELERRADLLMAQQQQLVEADAMLQRKDRNIGVLAHDLRNPLAVITTGAQLLTRLPEESAQAHRIARRIDRSARRMTALIRDILDYTRGRLGGGVPLKRQPTDLAVLARSAVEEILAGYPAARIEVETAGRLTGEWDPARIEQALSNLLANAIQHGGSNIKLVLSGEDREQVVLSVHNSGDPIPPAELPDIFEAFKKGDGNPNGLGLGLFIVREIALAHEGSVGVTSDAEATVFTVRLPRRTALENGPRDEALLSRAVEPPVDGLPPVSSHAALATVPPDRGEQIGQ